MKVDAPRIAVVSCTSLRTTNAALDALLGAMRMRAHLCFRNMETSARGARADSQFKPVVMSHCGDVHQELLETFAEAHQWTAHAYPADEDGTRILVGRADFLIAVTECPALPHGDREEQIGDAETARHAAASAILERVQRALKYDIPVIWIDHGEVRWIDLHPRVFESLRTLPGPPFAALRGICPKWEVPQELLKDQLYRRIQKAVLARLHLMKLRYDVSSGRVTRLMQWCSDQWNAWFSKSFEPMNQDTAKKQLDIVKRAEIRAGRRRRRFVGFVRVDVRAISEGMLMMLRNRRPVRSAAATPRRDDGPAAVIANAFNQARKPKVDNDRYSISKYATVYQGLHRWSFLATTSLIVAMIVLPRLRLFADGAHPESAPAVAGSSTLHPSTDRTVAPAVAPGTSEYSGNTRAWESTVGALDASSSTFASEDRGPSSWARAAQSAIISGLAWVELHVGAMLSWAGFVCLLLALSIYYLARRLEWHAKAIDVRVISERLRHAPIMQILGIDPSDMAEQLPHYTEHDAQKSWIGPAYRELAIEVLQKPEVLGAVQDLKSNAGKHWDSTRGQVVKWLNEQIVWLDRTALSYHLACLLSEHLCRLLLVLALVFHLIGLSMGWPGAEFAAAVLPVICFAIGLIGGQAELGRMASRYRALATVLSELRSQVDSLGLYSRSNEAVLRALGTEALRAALAEAFEWRLVHRFHPIHSPV